MLFRSDKKEFVAIDLETGTGRTFRWKGIPDPYPGTNIYPQPDGRSVIRIDLKGDAWIFDTKTATATRFGNVLKAPAGAVDPEVPMVTRAQLSPDRKRLILESGTELIAAESSGRSTRHRMHDAPSGYGPLTTSMDFLADGSIRYSAGQFGDLRVVDWNPSSGNITPRFDASKIRWDQLGGKLEPSLSGGAFGGFPGGYAGGMAIGYPGGYAGGMEIGRAHV